MPVSNGTVYLGSRHARVLVSRLGEEVAQLDQTPLPVAPQERGNLSGLAPDATPVTKTVCNGLLLTPIEGLSVAAYETISAGMFDPPPGSDANLTQAYSGLPAVCRVTGQFVPTRDTVMPFEMWLPLQDWSGEAQGSVFQPASGIAAASDISVLDGGIGVFGLAVPADGQVDIGNPVGRFRDLVGRLLSSTQPASRAFLGTTGVRSGGTALHSMQIIPRGPGRMEGRVTVNDQPVVGLPLRLMLDSLHWSPWVSTNADGIYAFDLPYGTYSIKGYSLDADSAEMLLAGRMDKALQPTRKEEIVIDGETVGRALDLAYVDPIVVRWPVGEVTVGEARQIVWDQYPGASHYWIWFGRRDGARRRVDGLKTSWSAHDVRGTSIEVPATEIGLAGRLRNSYDRL